MEITIDLLKNHPDSISRLVEIWYKILGKIWVPDVSIEDVRDNFQKHLNDNSLPLTLVAFSSGVPVGMCSLRENDGIRPDLTPWLGSLVVHPHYQKRGIGKLLIKSIQDKGKNLGFKTLYLFAFDASVVDYYVSLGWKKIDQEEFKGHIVTLMEIEI